MNKVLFKLYYNPRIMGAKNIPSNGPTILCGNHLDELDSELVSCATKRKVVWLNNDNMDEVKGQLDDGGVVGIFPEKVINIYRLQQLKIMLLEDKIVQINCSRHMRGTDCMTEVARLQTRINDELNNLSLVKEQLISFGINVIDYDILLPFDDAAFKLAREFSAKIVPFGLSGDYSFLSRNLEIRFGEPIIYNDLNENNNKLRRDVKQLIYKSF